MAATSEVGPENRTSSTGSKLYQAYYQARGADRNRLASNPGVVFQVAASWICLVRAVQKAGIDPCAVRVLDVGGAGGGSVLPWLELGACADQLVVVDAEPARIEQGRQTLRGVEFICADARQLDIPDDTFDVVMESTMFMTLPDDAVAKAIAWEMIRVTKPGGWLMLRDWSMPRSRDPSYAPLTHQRLRRLFAVGAATRLAFVTPGALAPPVGRFLSHRAPWAYFLVQAALPPLVAMRCYALRRQ
jgi:SAM-dependent methyltransferase